MNDCQCVTGHLIMKATSPPESVLDRSLYLYCGRHWRVDRRRGGGLSVGVATHQ